MQVEVKQKRPKSLLEKGLWVVLVVLSINFVLGLLSSGIEELFKKFDIFGWGENWRDTVSTDNGIKGQTNGGLTIKEIESFEEDAVGKPHYSDIFKQSVVVESDNYVGVYRKIEGSDDFYNLNFLKTDKGLVYDGVVGVETKGIKTNWWNGKRDFTNAKTTLSNKVSLFSTKPRDFFTALFGYLSLTQFKTPVENTVTFSDFKTSFAPGYDNTNLFAGWIQNKEAKTDLFNYISKYLADNVMYPHFQTLTDNLLDIDIELKNGIENIDNARVIKQQLNSFATHLWQNSKSVDGSDKTSMIDVSKYFGSFIPEDLQENYPITSEDKSNFSGFEYYPMYDNKIFFDTAYIRSDAEPKRDVNIISKDRDVLEDKKQIDEVVKQDKQYSKLQIKLNNKSNANLNTVDLKNNPVVVKVGYKTLLFDDITKIKNGYEIAVESNKSYNFNITSKLLMFDSYSGTLPVGKENTTKSFDFTYNQGLVNAEIEIHAISNVDKSKINLSQNPVKITLTGLSGQGNYQFNFDNNTKLNITLNQLLKAGDYAFSITSNQLIFGSTTGVIKIDASNRLHVFTYGVIDNDNESDINLSVLLLDYNIIGSSPGKADVVVKNYITKAKIKSYLHGSTSEYLDYTITLRIYDDFENLIYIKTQTSSNSNPSFELNNSLIDSNKYTAQITFSTNDYQKSLVSKTASFRYDSSKHLRVVYE